MSSSLLQLCITKFIQIVGYNIPSLVDNIFVNVFDKTIFSGNLPDKVTHHFPNFKIIKILSVKSRIKKIKIRGMKYFDQFEKYTPDIKELCNLNLCYDVDNMFKFS